MDEGEIIGLCLGTITDSYYHYVATQDIRNKELLEELCDALHRVQSSLNMERGSNVDYRSHLIKFKWPIEYALILNDVVLAKMMMHTPGYVQNANKILECGATLLQFALKLENSTPIIDLLVRNGANPNNRGLPQPPRYLLLDSPLHIAIQQSAIDSSRAEVVMLLISAGADIEARNCNNMTPLHVALQVNEDIIVNILLQRGANVYAKDSLKWTTLHYAALHDNVENLQILIKKGVKITDVDIDFISVLHIAASKNHFNTVKLLVESGAEIDALDVYGTTPLFKNILFFREGTNKKCSGEVAEYLLSIGANPDVFNKQFGWLYSTAKSKSSPKVAWIILLHLALQEFKTKEKPSTMIKSRIADNALSVYQSYLAELTLMQQQNIMENLTYYDILVHTKLHIANFAGRQKFRSAFSCPNLKLRFPHYADLLKNRMIAAIKRHELYESTAEKVNSSSTRRLRNVNEDYRLGFTDATEHWFKSIMKILTDNQLQTISNY